MAYIGRIVPEAKKPLRVQLCKWVEPICTKEESLHTIAMTTKLLT